MMILLAYLQKQRNMLNIIISKNLKRNWIYKTVFQIEKSTLISLEYLIFVGEG
jgi:hypothetical protein